jgi:cation transporter-like permease
VAVCAAGLVAGPWVGLAVGGFVTWLAVAYHGLPLGSIVISMLCGGLAGGLLNRWRPKLAQNPATFLVPAVSRERGPTRNSIFAAGWATPARGASNRIVAGDER